jgi:hypothetical protein
LLGETIGENLWRTVERFGEREALENTRISLESLVAELATGPPVEASSGR